jgi:hypothetical protein
MTELTIGEALWRLFRNHAQSEQPKLDAPRVADWLFEYADSSCVLPRALHAAAVCEIDLDLPPFTSLQRKVEAWGLENYQKLHLVVRSSTTLAPEVVQERARCFGNALAMPFTAAVENWAYQTASLPPPRLDPYIVQKRQEYARQRDESRRRKPGALYPV